MSGAYKRTGDLFSAAVHSDDDFGYPNGVEFVPGDQEWTDEVVWRNLIEGQPTLLVGETSELLLIPRRRSIIDHLRKSVTTRVEFRVNGQRSEFAVSGHFRRRDFDEQARRV